MKEKKKRKFAVPHTYVLLFVMVAICGLMTWIIPAGEYDRIEDPGTGRMVIDAASFHFTDGGNLGIFDIMKEFMTGMVSSGDIIFLIFVMGGSFMILQNTGALSAGVHAIARKFGKKQNIVLILFMFLFSLLGGTIGVAEELIVFIPLLVMLCNELKLDRIVALAVCMVGARIGFTTGLLNPFTVGVAQSLAGLDLYSALSYRLIWYGIIFVFTCWYVIHYANKIKKDPTKSLMYGVMIEGDDEIDEEVPMTKGRLCVIVGFAVTLIVMIYGVFNSGWYMTEIATAFLILGILSGIVTGMKGNEIAKSFVNGAKDMVFAALVVGVAKAILLTLQDGNIIDTVIFYASSVLGNMPKVLAANGMYVFQLLLNFLIPSGSGQAAATMPIMAPLADTLGITRQTAVLAFHYGDGFTNLIAPTVGALMACIAVSKVPFEKYLKWVAPLLAFWVAMGFLSVTVATIINLP